MSSGEAAKPPVRSRFESLLAEARLPDGSQRFYPPYKHPATAQLREQHDALIALPESGNRDAALAWVERQLAVFEHSEDRAKRDYLAAALDTSDPQGSLPKSSGPDSGTTQ